ncbi:MAG: glycosyltransferase family 4 protein [Proteobacteria bacterium]|nr:glycosyltransferase family 4 protein [Pseudomonadota bacterium]MBU4129818.1 glycosyltransferase family 4 protein [Pseudomonadota bacterium]
MLVKFMIPVMKEQMRQGHDVCVCVSVHKDLCMTQSAALSVSKFEEAGVDVYAHGLNRSINPVQMCKAIYQVRQLLKEHAVDVVICHSVLGSVLGRISAWLAGVRHRIYFCHGLACGPGENKLSWIVKYSLERFMAMFTTGMLVMNRYDYRLSKSHNFVKKEQLFMTSGMGIDVSEYDVSDSGTIKKDIYKELGISSDKKLVICVARLIAKKGVRDYICAAIDICFKREDVCFLLVGDGPLMSVLTHSIAKAGVEDRVKLLGWRDDVARVSKAADIFVLPSYYPEGLSIAVLEAMAAGKAVITTNNRGCEDSVKNNVTGIVIPMRNLPQLVKSITRLLDNSRLRESLGKNARAHVLDHYTLAYCTRVIVTCLNNCIKPLC